MPITADLYYPGEWHIGGAEAYVLHLARSLSRVAEVRILATTTFDQIALRKALRVGGPSVEVVLLSAGSATEIQRTSRCDLFVNCDPWTHIVPPRNAISALLIYYAPAISQLSLSRRTAMAIARRRQHTPANISDRRRVILAYNRILSASRWTGALVEERWKRDWDLLYPAVPPVSCDPVTPAAKEHLILTVGRIGAGGTDKGHLAMADIFSRLQLEDWTMVVAGATNYPATEAIADAIAERGSGRVVVVRNPSPEMLADLYQRASLYWHAAGLNATKGAISHEHFGISIVEAMSTGAVPLAHASGGPLEILAGRLAGCLWSSEAELRQSTGRLAADASELQGLSTECVSRSQAYSPAKFDERVDELLRVIFA